MKKTIFFFGSFDPLHKGHISILNKAINKIHPDKVYLGLNLNSKKSDLTPFSVRMRMLKEYTKTKPILHVLNFGFDYSNIEKTYENIFKLVCDKDKNYILIGADQITNLNNWYNLDKINDYFTFIFANRKGITNTNYNLDAKLNYISISHKYEDISSSLIRKGDLTLLDSTIRKFIVNNNLYMEERIRDYLDADRFEHTLSVLQTALLINKKSKLGLDVKKVEQAALLHDIAKNIEKKEMISLINEYYPDYLNESFKLYHQYLGEYIAKKYFDIKDRSVLEAIKYHTTGKKRMSILGKLIYVSDKIEPRRGEYTKKLINSCCKDFNKGFIEVLKRNYEYLDSKHINIENKDSKECFEYYLN